MNVIIGISLSLDSYSSPPFISQTKLGLNQLYVDAILAAGAIPILLPVVGKALLPPAYASHIDGLLLSGGEDIHPSCYQEEEHPALGKTTPSRDAYELELVSSCFSLRKPILGICRGMQLLNVAFGGTLFQDLPQQYYNRNIVHWQENPPHEASHSIMSVEGSFISKIFSETPLNVNSLHHQGIKRLAEPLRTAARSADGLIEAIEHPLSPFLVGVQWHPEQMTVTQDSPMKELFRSFVAKAKEQKSQHHG